MQEFYQWLIFESFIILISIILYLFAAGVIHTKRTRRQSFIEWRQTTGGVIRWMCILIVVTSIGIVIYKYYQVQNSLNEPPSLETE